jgi:hypothetical protein
MLDKYLEYLFVTGQLNEKEDEELEEIEEAEEQEDTKKRSR